jgi:hypothetical protein
MIDFLLGILGMILELVLSFIAPLMILAGEFVRVILSVGYYRPRWNKAVYKEFQYEFPIKSVSFWVGIGFWVCFGIWWEYYLRGD